MHKKSKVCIYNRESNPSASGSSYDEFFIPTSTSRRWEHNSKHFMNDLSIELRTSVDSKGADAVLNDLENLFKENPKLFWVGSKQRDLVMKDIKMLKRIIGFKQFTRGFPSDFEKLSF